MAIMKFENSRYDRSAVPESAWPDGSRVSSWSKAVAALGLATGRMHRESNSLDSGSAETLMSQAA